jgi:Forkhead domain
MAIEDSLQKALPVKEIYAWIIQHFPYFKTACDTTCRSTSAFRKLKKLL